MQQDTKIRGYPAKLLIATVTGILAWSLSVYVVPTNHDTGTSGIAQCQASEVTEHLFQSMVDGIITHMRNDGGALQVEISHGWKLLNNTARAHLYESLSCLAQQEDVALRIRASRDHHEETQNLKSGSRSRMGNTGTRAGDRVKI